MGEKQACEKACGGYGKKKSTERIDFDEIESICFGELGIRPWDLHRMTWREVVLSINGLRDRDKMLESWIRRSTFIIASTNFGGKSISGKIDKLWPIENEKPKVPERALEQLRKFREAEALKRAKIKLDAR